MYLTQDPFANQSALKTTSWETIIREEEENKVIRKRIKKVIQRMNVIKIYMYENITPKPKIL